LIEDGKKKKINKRRSNFRLSTRGGMHDDLL